MPLPPIHYHYFSRPVSYNSALALQEKLHALQLSRRRAGVPHPDLLLLLEHRPVYTAGRRQNESAVAGDRDRLTKLGADFVSTMRGGEYTYHGPGQIVGYPLLDLGRTSPPMGIRDYICRVQTLLKKHLQKSHGLEPIPSDNTGVFLAADAKIASIGVQVRHRLTTHGFAINITREPLPWFDNIIACGLEGVKATSIASATGESLEVRREIPSLVERFAESFERDVIPFELNVDEEMNAAIEGVEKEVY